MERTLGGGGFGQVWQAVDLLRDRDVAVKFLHRDVAASGPVWLSKFRQEAKIAVRLNHRNITAVDDFGEHEGQWYLVMEFLRGKDLAEEMAGHPHGLPVPRAVTLAARIAEGLAAAHEHGVVHRDLKPANLMLLDGDQVKICDFGIAHIAEASATHTLHGRKAGTPAYMAPEQWRGDPVDDRTDLYALGGILYVLLTGHPVFRGPSVDAFMGQHLNAEPAAPSTDRPEIPEALDRLVLDLLAKEPGQRPGSAEEVLARLRGSEDAGVPPARPDVPLRPVPRRGDPPGERGSPLEPDTAARISSAPLIPRRTLVIAAAVAAAVVVVPFVVIGGNDGSEDRRFRVRFTLSGHDKFVSSVAFSPDGSRIVTAGSDDTVKVWSAGTGALITTLTDHEYGGGTLAFSPDGSRLVTAGSERPKLWNFRTGALISTINDPSGVNWKVRFNPASSLLVTVPGVPVWTAKLWTAKTGALVKTLAGHRDYVSDAVFSPDGSMLVTTSGDHTAKMWNARTGALITTLTGHKDTVSAAAFSPDGSRLATSSWDKTIKVWNARTGVLVTTLTESKGSVSEVVFSPDGRTLATDDRNTVRIWNARTGSRISSFDGKRKLVPFIGTPHYVSELTFSPDGSLLAAASADIVMILERTD
nr:serine/threonine-protein kinase [Actinomadura sp. RB99]